MSSWYFHKNLKPQGPLDHTEMKRKIMKGEVGPTDLILQEGGDSWLPAAEWREFPRELFPAFQKNYFKNPSPQEREWVLLVFNSESSQGRQEGPYSLEDINRMLSAGDVRAEDYIWRSGLTGWVQVKDRAEFLIPPTSPDL